MWLLPRLQEGFRQVDRLHLHAYRAVDSQVPSAPLQWLWKGFLLCQFRLNLSVLWNRQLLEEIKLFTGLIT